MNTSNMNTYKITELSFSKICCILSAKDTVEDFYMHYDASDAMHLINSERYFDAARDQLMQTYGDVEVEINPNACWFDRVKILDDVWNKAHQKYCLDKVAWCAKYGCD